MKKTNNIVIEVSAREAAFICLMRRIGFGTLDKVGIQDSQPAVVSVGAQRIDLCKADELKRVLENQPMKDSNGKDVQLVAVDLTPGHLPSTIKAIAEKGIGVKGASG